MPTDALVTLGLDWIGLDLFNDTRSSGHISRPMATLGARGLSQ